MYRIIVDLKPNLEVEHRFLLRITYIIICKFIKINIFVDELVKGKAL